MRVLVTGGAGYLGSVLCEHLLAAGHRVTVLDALTFGQASLFGLCGRRGFDFERGDVRERATLERLASKADVIIPLAAIVGAPACEREPRLTREVNLDAIRTLDEIRSKDQLVVYPVTNSGYGRTSGELHCTEDTPLDPISLYGQTKVEAEATLLARGRTISLRLATVFGMSPRMRLDLLVNHFVYAAYTDRYIVIFEKDFKRNYIHVRDVADCFVHCIEHADSMAGRPYNAGLDDANYSKETLALKVREQVPEFYIHFSEIGTNPDRRNYIVSNQRLRDAGFEARRGVEDGIRELLMGYAMLPARRTAMGEGPW